MRPTYLVALAALSLPLSAGRASAEGEPQAMVSGGDRKPNLPQCDPTAPSCCGNHICESDDENFGNCPIDCRTCGNGVCDAGEDEGNCARDCGCVPVGCGSRCGTVDDGCGHSLDCGSCGGTCNHNGVCDGGENHQNCPDDCPGSCVPEGCGSRCGMVDDGCGHTLNCGSCEPPPGVDDAEITAPRLPFSLRCSESYNASVTVRNTGTSTWTRAAGYKLGAIGDTDPFASPRVELPAGASVPPGASYTFAFTMTAPPEGGTFVSDWQMLREYVHRFGGAHSETIQVYCSCGNGVCDEPAASCPQDCLVSICNNNGVCDPGETAAQCPLDNCVCVPTLNCVGKCGIHDDGCGHPADCGTCQCTPNVPTFTASLTHAGVGEPILFTANGSLILDPPAPLWDMGNAVHLSGNPLVYQYPAPGTYNVVLTAADAVCHRVMVSSPTTIVIDPLSTCVLEPDNPGKCCGNGVCDPGDQDACPEECPTRPGFTVAVEAPSSAKPGEEVVFHAAVTTNPGEQVTSYEWAFGDGGTATGENATHTFGEDGLYVVSVAATSTAGIQASASRVISIQSVPDVGEEHHLECTGGGCDHESDFRFDQHQNRLVPLARFWINRQPNGDWLRFHPVARAVIIDPDRKTRFDSGFVDGYEQWLRGLSPDLDHVEIDFHDFQEAAFNPKPGKWTLRVNAYYRPIENTQAKPVSQGLADDLPVYIDACLGGPCLIVPDRKEIYDGTAGSFELNAPLPGRIYEWSATFSLLLENGYPVTPNANLTPIRGERTTANKPVWVPVPPAPSCDKDVVLAQALKGSKYNLGVRDITGGGQATGQFTVVVPWGARPEESFVTEDGELALGQTTTPKATFEAGDDGVVCDAQECTLNVAALKFVRHAPFSRIVPSLAGSSSALKAKTIAHEANHRDFFQSADRCGFKFFNTDQLRTKLLECVVDGRCVSAIESTVAKARREVLQAAREVEKQVYSLESLSFLLGAQEKAEYEAYEATKDFPPAHFAKNCGFTDHACPR